MHLSSDRNSAARRPPRPRPAPRRRGTRRALSRRSPPPARRHLRLVGTLALAAGLLGACGTSGASVRALSPRQILTSDPVAHTVHLLLEASQNDAYGGFNFDGYGAGHLTVEVPRGWTVEVTCENHSTTFRHSCAVIDNAPISTHATHVAFGASVPDPRQGIPFHAVDHFSFVAGRTGRFRIVCLVTAHEADGMWDWLVVTPGGRPAVRT